MNTIPRVTIGLPVYNGQRYLGEAIESVLAQTYDDWALVISDNASTDHTEQICREHAARDRRVIYIRKPNNEGATRNFVGLARSSESPYFKWLAHDDRLAPTYLQRCVELLDADDDLGAAHSLSDWIDAGGEVTGRNPREDEFSSACVYDRVRHMIWVEYFTIVWAVMRRSLLDRLRLRGDFSGADRNWMFELALYTRVDFVPESLHYIRNHPESYSQSQQTYEQRRTWFDPSARLPGFAQGLVKTSDYVHSLFRAPVDCGTRLGCMGQLGLWAMVRFGQAAGAGLGRIAGRWGRRRSARDVTAGVPSGAHLHHNQGEVP